MSRAAFAADAADPYRAPPVIPDPADLPTETFNPADDDDLDLVPSRRADGWSAANQRAFLEAIAEGHGVEVACGRVGLSVASAYAFRRTAKGAAFALGWRAATLVARDVIAETLLVRALQGQVDTLVRADGSTVTRHRHDNRLAMSLLARLDRQVESAPDVDVKAARLVAQEFDAFLGLVERDGGPARAGLFLARRSDALKDATGKDGASPDLAPILALAAADRLARTGVATAGEVAVADLDPTRRADWTTEQWARAEAAGLVALAIPAPPEDAPAPQHPQHSQWTPEPQEPVWWDEEAEEWRTRFPPPEDFLGQEEGDYGDGGYERALSEEEAAAFEAMREAEIAPQRAREAAERDAWFALRAAGEGAPDDPPDMRLAA